MVERRRILFEEDSLPVGTSFDFDYTGDEQEITLPKGTYKLEVWGAQGGSNGEDSTYGIESMTGGKGGYSAGILTLSQKTTLYVFVGGAGTSIPGEDNGGYNGGGDTAAVVQGEIDGNFNIHYTGGGGGATDIRTVSPGTYSSYLDRPSLLSRMIVAGGGSGSCGGYYAGYASSYRLNLCDGDAGGGATGGGKNPGTQTSGHEFGWGSSAVDDADFYRHIAGAAGSGWYGGDSYGENNSRYHPHTGGGSGFVNIAENAQYRPSGYTGLELDFGRTIQGNKSFPAPGGGTEIGHAGNGYARITKSGVGTVRLYLKDSSNTPISGVQVTLTSSTLGSTALTTDSSGMVSCRLPHDTYTIAYKNYVINTTQITVTGNMTVNITGLLQYNYKYTGAVQTETLSAGTYKIECWGAQGGSYNTTKYGGKGGYSVGELTLASSTTVYIYIGGKGAGGNSSGQKHGGFNGGGNAIQDIYPAGSGGGASDVRIGQDSLYARVIVAGGGGGIGGYTTSPSDIYIGGCGGGLSGGTGSQAGTGGSQNAKGNSYYGTQTNSNNFGTIANFGNGGSMSTSYEGSGGGGGWYGGGYSYRGPGGGGSGYVYTSTTASNYPSGCLLNSTYYLANAYTTDGQNSMPSVSGSTETGHEGDGYVVITKI